MIEHRTERATREQRRKALIERGYNPYPARVARTHQCREVEVNFDALESSAERISITGRIRSLRKHGGSCFLDLEDQRGRLQVFVKKDSVGDSTYSLLVDFTDVGDFAEISGTAYRTQRGEKSLLAQTYRIISKSLEPLPEKWHGLSDVEVRYRKRYLDLLANSEIKTVFKKRDLIMRAVRKFLEAEQCMEVETPVLQPIPGGALARPFTTHHNALGSDFYLRVAPELYLKRLIVGGFEKVYEVARCFRNEGVDHSHNPEFTQVECYIAYMDYEKLMEFIEQLIASTVTAVTGELKTEFEGHMIEFFAPFQRITFRDALQKYAKIDIDKFPETSSLHKELLRRDFRVEPGWQRAEMMDELLKDFVRPALIQPTFIYRYPVELSPLSKKTEDDQRYVERFQLFCAGKEIVNAFSEINDAIDQRERFTDQDRRRAQGNEELHRIDEEFLDALAHGMPPTAGFGLGIDRLTNILTNTHSIKEVIFFPTLKPSAQ